ncbi:uncharacterized protein KQ657_002331 [Scheffersomyces spartinae]|uniref:Uncharacterized protein n=1 Tax=Scheffersomyces spartinae TaxID=45513 RepID=A0A9P8AJZ6_9ASCO|nr:uncharacterized protein KQ657_002331 [Scheffersomyces spartinae]KAG7195945.1 hypothetical protein KQ657_002331 [Scheffersomyces spartinae]
MSPLHEITNDLAVNPKDGYRKSPCTKRHCTNSITFELGRIPKPKLQKEQRSMDGKKTCIPHPDRDRGSTALRLSPRSKLPPPRHSLSSRVECAPVTEEDDDTSVTIPLVKVNRIRNALRILQNSMKRPSTSPILTRTFLDVMRDNELEEKAKLDQVEVEIEQQLKVNQKLKRRLQEEHEIELHCIRQSRIWRDERDQVVRDYDNRKHKFDMEIQSSRDKTQLELAALRKDQQEARKQLMITFEEEIKQAKEHHDNDALDAITEYKEMIMKYREQLDAANVSRMKSMAEEEAKFDVHWIESQKYRIDEVVVLERKLQERQDQVDQVSTEIADIKSAVESGDPTAIKKAINDKDTELRDILQRERYLNSQIQQYETEYEELKKVKTSIQPVVEDAQRCYNDAYAKLQDLKKQILFLNNSIFKIESKVRVFIRSSSSTSGHFDGQFPSTASNQEVLFEISSQVPLVVDGSFVSQIFVGDNPLQSIFWDAVEYALENASSQGISISSRIAAVGDRFYHDLLDNHTVIDSIGEARLVEVSTADLFIKACQAQGEEKFKVPIAIQMLVGKGKITLIQLGGDIHSQLGYLKESLDFPSTCVASTLNSLFDNSICLLMGDFTSEKSENTLSDVLFQINSHVSGYTVGQ